MKKDQLGNEIRSIRKRKSWSQSLLAEASGLSIRTIQRLEKKGVGAPETLLAVAGALDIDVTDLTSKTSEPSSLLSISFEKGSIRLSLQSWFNKKLESWRKAFFSIGLLTGLMPGLFIMVNLLKYVMGFEGLPNPFEFLFNIPIAGEFLKNYSPFFFFGGLLISGFINSFPLLDLDIYIGKENNGFISYKGNKWNLFVVLYSIVSFCILLLYGLVENSFLSFSL